MTVRNCNLPTSDGSAAAYRGHRGPAFLSLAVLLFAGAGCTRMLAPIMGRTASVEGNWTGHIVVAKLTDPQGQTYDAAALQIWEGPRLPYQHGNGGDLAAQNIAALTRSMTASPVLLPPDALGVRPGTRVRVTGLMVAGLLAAGEENGEQRPVSARPSYRAESELIIIMRGNPKPIRP